ncbi:iron-sulfur cluster repair di-iron protein [Cesiribacter andamanensis]|uniref:Regulator of cell morphogenesis and NO signaling n=1 Tax=Cesiribacter andamanensis AMV16 TaxID=1279009 RepID=M7NV99_9BACT|nr:iron-sulfur cluster repair di-iron protein [Cesiribacter andamanensis]EMR02384.1 Regulator of cell morphogenesis and NO signaling [Cesiribacter andamanensis AMV16]
MIDQDENILDVTTLVPREKHPTIFKRFEALLPGERLIIHNDHDPKPLYYQMLGELGNVFSWEYTEQGPEWWKVILTRRAAGEADTTLGELAAKDIRKAQVFRKWGLDFCCGGKKTVKEACAEKGLDVTLVEQELQQADRLQPAARPLPYNEWDPAFLADYIVNTHHSYVRQMLPELSTYAQKVARVHGQQHPELLEINRLVESIWEELMGHLPKEEEILFPFIKQLVQASSSGRPLEKPHFGTVENPVRMMEMEHEAAGHDLEKIRELSNHYTLPEDACGSYRLLFSLLEEFESDLHLHIHLENNILFPKALELEKALRN